LHSKNQLQDTSRDVEYLFLLAQRNDMLEQTTAKNQRLSKSLLGFYLKGVVHK